MDTASPFHSGEHEVQARLGVRDVETWARKVVRPFLPEEHRAFHTALPFLVAAARDEAGRPWATLLAGADGFVASPDPRTLCVDAQPVPGDALEGALVPGADVGLLGIELASRRRNRVNGRVGMASEGRAWRFEVDQSFGNCPQYIREREWTRVDDVEAGAALRSEHLNAAQRSWIEAADTFFIASGHRGEGEDAAFGMDASHRGGDPGFVVVPDARRLTFPDYAGNNHFNTLGNLVVDPLVGLLFVDFETGGLLQLSGRARIEWDGASLEDFPGARRLVHVEIESVVELPEALPLRWSDADAGVRSLRVVDKVHESADVTSFVLEARDGAPLAPFEAGQHLPLELEMPGRGDPLRRTYSLSNAPATKRYRISVKREPLGAASRFLHDEVEIGAVLSARAPAGDFVLGCTSCPTVLVSAGVGATPVLSMLHRLVDTEGEGPIYWIHGARDGAHHPFAGEVRQIAAAHPRLETCVVYSRPRAEEDLPGVDFDLEGRVDAELIARLPIDPDAHYYLCGPPTFMAEFQTGVEALGVPAERIHTESFGPRGENGQAAQ